MEGPQCEPLGEERDIEFVNVRGRPEKPDRLSLDQLDGQSVFGKTLEFLLELRLEPCLLDDLLRVESGCRI